jgi:hypothetical protein
MRAETDQPRKRRTYTTAARIEILEVVKLLAPWRAAFLLVWKAGRRCNWHESLDLLATLVSHSLSPLDRTVANRRRRIVDRGAEP